MPPFQPPSSRNSRIGRIIIYTVYPMPDGGGMATHEDVTGREEMSARLKTQYDLGKAQEENLRIRNLQFDTAINNMSQGLCFFDAAHRLIVCNDRYIEMYDLPPDRVGPGTSLTEIVDMRFEAGRLSTRCPGTSTSTGAPNVAISAKPQPRASSSCATGATFKIRHRPMPDFGWGLPPMKTSPSSGDPRSRSNTWAHHDSLTDLANRVLLNERLEHALDRTDPEQMVAVHHLDLDQFKAVNDTFGHPAGDKLLKIVADRFAWTGP